MIKQRNMWMQVVLMIVTLGIYSIYWFYVTSREMLDHQEKEGSAGLWTFVLFVPFGSFYSYWQHSKLVESVTGERYNHWLIYILWFFFTPATWFLTQRELNRIAERQAQEPLPA